MARRKKGKGGGDFNSFIDIMTCLAGVLILIILLVILQIQEVRVVIPTPIARETDKMPVFVECRSNMLYRVDVAEIRKLVDDRLKEFAQESADGSQLDRMRFMQKMGESKLEHGPHIIDLSFAMMGQLAMRPKPDAEGYKLVSVQQERPTDWFGSLLGGIDSNREMVTFIVRDDSFEVFKKARALAWVNDVDASWYLVPYDQPISIGLSGEAPITQ